MKLSCARVTRFRGEDVMVHNYVSLLQLKLRQPKLSHVNAKPNTNLP